MICDASYLHLKALYFPCVAFKRGIEIDLKAKENFASRELNPGLLRDSLTPLPLDYQGYMKIFENFIEYFWQIFLAAVAGITSQDRQQSKILLEKFVFVFGNFHKEKGQKILSKVSKTYAWLDLASVAWMLDTNLDTKNYSRQQLAVLRGNFE